MSNEMKDWMFDQWEDKLLEEWKKDKLYPADKGPDTWHYWSLYSAYLLDRLYRAEGVVEVLTEKLYG